MNKIFYYGLLLVSQFIWSQEVNEIIGDWSGWYKEGQKNYDTRLEIERFNGIVYEGKITLIYDEKEAQFSIEGDVENGLIMINERDMLSQYAPDYITDPQWCKADYVFKFSDLGEYLQLEGTAKVPEVNIAYLKGVKVYDSSKCTYFEKGIINLKRKNSLGIISNELITQQKEYPKAEVSEVRYNKDGKRLATANSKPRYTKEEDDFSENKGREVVETKTIESNEGIAEINVWDNRSVDGDIISIYHNGKLVEENISLVKAKQSLSINLEKGKNVIVMHAINLGEIPPNSAAMNVSTGDKEYSMILTSDTQKSESIVIYYYP